jgi:hypothetical protein
VPELDVRSTRPLFSSSGASMPDRLTLDPDHWRRRANFTSRLKPRPGPGFASSVVVAKDEQLGQNRSDNTPMASRARCPLLCAM